MLNMVYPQLYCLKIPVTNLTFYLVLTVPSCLTKSWMPLVGKWVWFWCADNLYCLFQFSIYNVGDDDFRCLLRHAGHMFGWFVWASLGVVIYTVFD